MATIDQWTVLLYIAGNNDLEETLAEQFKVLQNIRIPPNINVAAQFGRKVQENNAAQRDSRRYISKNGWLALSDSLGCANMGKATSFIEFLLWGYSQFTANRLMLVMCGHSAGFAGIMMDCGREIIDLISIREFVQALSSFYTQTQKSIDIMVFDTCYMNLVEIWYELALAGHCVKYLIVPQENPPMQGLPWHALINLLISNEASKYSVKTSVKNIVQSINLKFPLDTALFAISLAPEIFIVLKALINNLAILILDNKLLKKLPGLSAKPSALISLQDLIKQADANLVKANACCKGIENVLSEFVFYPGLNEFIQNRKMGPSIYLPNHFTQYMRFQPYYDTLSFASNNSWIDLLSCIAPLK
ncbi:MAG: clostripain-related cysteine peptidase [Phycisphaerales bacterium]